MMDGVSGGGDGLKWLFPEQPVMLRKKRKTRNMLIAFPGFVILVFSPFIP